MSKDLRNSFEKWLKTGAGKRIRDAFMGKQFDEYKINCLWWTYYAGAASGGIAMTNEIADILIQLAGRKTIPIHLRHKIQYIIDHKDDYTIENL